MEPLYFRREVALSVFETCLDIWIDLMIIALPIRLLWSVRIKLRQKIILGIFLSLNVFMAITACVRVAGLSFRGRYDELWFLVWQHIEACVAVAMVSLTAFRSAFISSDLLQRQKNLAKRQWYSSPLQTFRRKKASEQNDSEAILGLPSIPGGTVTGMQTFIEGGKHPRTVDEAGIHTTTSWKTDWAER